MNFVQLGWPVRAVLGVLLLAGISGCSESRGPTGTVSGTLLHNGKPAPQGTVVQFLGASGAASGTTSADGSFTVMGVPVGQYKVCIAPPQGASNIADDPKAAMMKAMEGGFKEMVDTTGGVPQKYRTPEESGVSFEVKEGINDFALDMKD